MVLFRVNPRLAYLDVKFVACYKNRHPEIWLKFNEKILLYVDQV